MNEDESAAMWDLYLGNGPEVAVESSFAALRDELDRATGDTAVAIGSVDYLDYQNDSWGPYRPFNAVFHKRRSFDHERELRAVIVRPTHDELGRATWDARRLAGYLGPGMNFSTCSSDRKSKIRRLTSSGFSSGRPCEVPGTIAS